MASAALRFFDACAGIGCFHHGMVKAGFTCVGAAELDERLQKEYPKAFGLDPSRMFGNLHEVTVTERWKAARDKMHGCVLTAGFPCQPFSKSGTQLGPEHAEGTVFGALVCILEDLQCPAFILENVENLTGEKHAETFNDMRTILRGMSYDIAFGKYSPDQIGIPQHRQRWFIIGIKRGDELEGSENEALLEDMDAAIQKAASVPKVILKDLLEGTSRRGSLVSDTEKQALVIWDKYLSWLVENPGIGKTPSPLWGMEAVYTYDIDKIQSILTSRKGKKIRKKDVVSALGSRHKKSFGRKAAIIDNLPPYLWDLVDERKEPYPDWKPRYIKNSRAHLMKIKDWLESEDRGQEWKDWVALLRSQDATFQKFEWHVREGPKQTRIKDDIGRVKKRFEGRLIQFRPSGVRVSKGDRHPALVAIGQVPVVGACLRRPPWQILAKLQSVPEEFANNNPALFGESSSSGNSGEPVKRLGNAVNVDLVAVVAGVIKHEIYSLGM